MDFSYDTLLLSLILAVVGFNVWMMKRWIDRQDETNKDQWKQITKNTVGVSNLRGHLGIADD